MSPEKPTIVVPGNRIGNLREFSSGSGTFAREASTGSRAESSLIYASLCGTVIQEKLQMKTEISVQRHPNKFLNHVNILPQVGSVILGRVVRILQHQASIDILAVNGQSATGSAYRGVIRCAISWLFLK